jgi:hypothetical protein
MEINIDEEKLKGIVRERMKAKLEVAGELVERWAKYYCPVDQGYLQGSIAHFMVSDDTVRISAGGTGVGAGGKKVGYAAMQEFGGIIKKSSKMLTIPLTKEAKYAKSAGDFKGLFVVTSKSGQKFLAQNVGKKKLKFHYLLTDQVNIPASPYLRPAYLDHKDEIVKILEL